MSEKSLVQRLAELRADAPVSLPSHPDVAVWRAPTEADIDAIRAVAVAADTVDHPTWTTPREEIADTFDLPHIDHARDSLVALDASGTIIAFGSSFLHPARAGALTAHLGGAVHPQWRRRGIGTVLLRWQRARGLEQLAQAAAEIEAAETDAAVATSAAADEPAASDEANPTTPTPRTADLKLYGEESQPDQQRLAERAGFTAERWFTSMERDMSAPLPTPPAPEGITIVAYTHERDDDARLARNDAFRDHWGSLPSQPESWAKFVGGPFFRADLSRLALDAEGAIVGFCLASVNEDDWQTLGATNSYIDLIGVVRAHRRRGVAPFVIAATLAAIGEAGLERAVLDVDTASPTGANSLYEGLGFVATERSVALVTRI